MEHTSPRHKDGGDDWRETAASLCTVWCAGRRGTDCWNGNPGEAVGWSSQWIFVRGLIGALAVIASVGCDQRAEMTREAAYSRQLSLDVAAIVAGMTRAQGASSGVAAEAVAGLSDPAINGWRPDPLDSRPARTHWTRRGEACPPRSLSRALGNRLPAHGTSPGKNAAAGLSAAAVRKAGRVQAHPRRAAGCTVARTSRPNDCVVALTAVRAWLPSLRGGMPRQHRGALGPWLQWDAENAAWTVTPARRSSLERRERV
jgi:hypothetical protein